MCVCVCMCVCMHTGCRPQLTIVSLNQTAWCGYKGRDLVKRVTTICICNVIMYHIINAYNVFELSGFLNQK